MSWTSILKFKGGYEDTPDFPMVDQFRGMLKEFSKEAETIKTPLNMLNLFKEIKTTVDEIIPKIEDIHRVLPEEGFSEEAKLWAEKVREQARNEKENVKNDRTK